MNREPIDWEQAEDSFLGPSLAAGDATGWFDRLYAAAVDGRVTMPWSRENPHPLLVDWAHRTQLRGAGRTAVVVGCALGADAEFIAGLGFTTVAFDVSATAITLARERHPDTGVTYLSADLLDTPAEWRHAFDLVVEIITLQALPPDLHARAAAAVRDLVASDGTLLVIGAVPDTETPNTAVPDDGTAAAPWPLTRAEIDALASDGLHAVAIDTLPMPDRPGESRWRAVYHRPAQN
ncbi:MAG: SAM-dependent methyltransferase [Pseudonocardiales bacterium]|nr:MAG: SAM-dependent methyltransferase [Pseudonocardiales bacterium]